MTILDVAGLKVHVRAWGSGPADALLIHGASSDIGVWEPTVAPLLKSRYRVLAYDRPGMGETRSRPRGSQALAAQARIAAGVIETAGLRRPIVVGHSYGGAVALRLALDRRDLVSGLLLIAPVAHVWPGGVSWHVSLSASPLFGAFFNRVLTRPFVNAEARAGLAGAFAPAPVPEHYFERAGVARVIRPGAMRASAEDVLALKSEIRGQQELYARIEAPTAILVGDSDRVVWPGIHALPLARALPHARIEVVKGEGHLPHEGASDRLIKLFDWLLAEGAQAGAETPADALTAPA